MRHLASTAREPAEARFASLAIVRPDGSTAEFVREGADEETAREIGHRPEGKGVLAALDDGPLRIDDLASHPAAAGFPPGHPPMHGFLGTPLTVRGRLHGRLYLADKHGTVTRPEPFTEEDEEPILALAAAAGLATDNALLLETSRHREVRQQATTALTAAFLAGTSERHAPQLIAEHARTMTDADLAAIALPDASGTLTIRAATAPTPTGSTGSVFPSTPRRAGPPSPVAASEQRSAPERVVLVLPAEGVQLDRFQRQRQRLLRARAPQYRRLNLPPVTPTHPHLPSRAACHRTRRLRGRSSRSPRST
ncbi:GAF domain-containing protein [Streptomyces sp. NPDC004284]|uniref:GAF domain-containing protein n=1 Tax=Streptomyces sp. NPDC004284 TaxID=3364695 RepID=UPI00367B464A